MFRGIPNMFEEYIISAVITGLSMFISSYAMLEITKNHLKKEFLIWIQTEQAAKLLYQVGGIVAQGAKSGFGLNVKGGKFKWQDLAAQLAGKYIGKMLGLEGRDQNPPQSTEVPDMNIT